MMHIKCFDDWWEQQNGITMHAKPAFMEAAEGLSFLINNSSITH